MGQERAGHSRRDRTNLVANEPGEYRVRVKGSATAPAVTSGIAQIKSNLAQAETNMMVVTSVLRDGISSGSNLYSLLSKEVAQSIDYRDGLGRTFQVVAVGQSPQEHDVVQPLGYSPRGLTETSYLPYVDNTRNGLKKTNAIRGTDFQYSSSDQFSFYQNASKVSHDNYPFAVAVLDPSPSARPREQGAPGNEWQPGNGHTVKSDIILNTAGQVRYWKPDGTTNSTYAANTLIVHILTDENGNKSRTFADRLGRTILTQIQIDETIEGTFTEWLETYTIYDAYGRVQYTIPPKAVKVLGNATTLNVNDNSVAELIFRYVYDSKGRVGIKKVPGAAEEHYVYDKFDRPVLIQDGNLRSQNRWFFVKYDRYDRVVYNGVYNRNVDRVTLQSEMDARDYDTEPYFDVEQINTTHGYSNQVYPTSDLMVLSVNYFDHYDFTRDGSADHIYDNLHLEGQDANCSTRTLGLPTGSKRVVLSETGTVTNNWLVTAVFYDQFDRPIQTSGNNYLNLANFSAEKATVQYDFIRPIKIKSSHSTVVNNVTTTVDIIDTPLYDHAGRTSKLLRKINNNDPVEVSRYEYNELGQLVDKKLHVTGNAFIQSVDYRYNIRGWLQSINNLTQVADNSNDDLNDYFGMELVYNNLESGLGNTQLYNGSISALKWKGPGQPEQMTGQRSYKYSYDKTNRLKLATFQGHSGSAWNVEANTLNETMSYDHNGNILSLVRKQDLRGLNELDVTSTPEDMDNLTYSYAGGLNRLTKVEDASTNAKGFKNGSNATTEYFYDEAGAVTRDENKGINNITYNMLGKPQVITFTDGRKIEYIYDAAGGKLEMKTYPAGVNTPSGKTAYVGNFVYENESLSFFGSPEGRIVKSANNFDYQYAIGDHQGNTRVVFSAATPAPSVPESGFESNSNDFLNDTGNLSAMQEMNHTVAAGAATSQRLTGGYTAQVGAATVLHVYPGDKVKAEVFAKYRGTASGPGYLNGFAAALTAAFGFQTPPTGEAFQAYASLNTFGAIAAAEDRENDDDDSPKGFITILILDKDNKILDAAWDQIDEDYYQPIGETTINYPFDLLTQEVTIREEGYVYIFLSNENPSPIDIHFDDIKVTHTKTNVIQYNEYYPFGLQTAKSWTRENATGNNFLYNGSAELNSTAQWYETLFRGYDAALGRFMQVDPMAPVVATQSPYSYAYNDPVYWNDPLGLLPDDTWWSVEGFRQGKFAGHGGSQERFAANNLSRHWSYVDPWVWTGMSGEDVYGENYFPRLGAGYEGRAALYDITDPIGKRLRDRQNSKGGTRTRTRLKKGSGDQYHKVGRTRKQFVSAGGLLHRPMSSRGVQQEKPYKIYKNVEDAIDEMAHQYFENSNYSQIGVVDEQGRGIVFRSRKPNRHGEALEDLGQVKQRLRKNGQLQLRIEDEWVTVKSLIDKSPLSSLRQNIENGLFGIKENGGFLYDFQLGERYVDIFRFSFPKEGPSIRIEYCSFIMPFYRNPYP